MSTYRYVATSLLTGRVYADELPIIVNSAKRQISSAADLTGYLPLQADPAKNLPFIQAMTPRKSVLFVLQDGFPVWGGPIWDTPHQSMKSNQLPFRASTLESLFAKRIISAGLSFTDMDVFEIARQLIAYATSPAIGPNAAVANLSLGSNLAGYTDTLTFGVSNTLQTADGDTYYGTFSDEQDVLDALTTTAAADSFEFTFEPTVTGNGGFGWNLRLASALGQPGGGQVLTYPGAVIDYGRPTMGSAAANYLIGTSSANGSGSTYTSQYPHGIDTADLADGMPLLQAPVSWPGAGVTSQAQINGYVAGLLGQYTAGTMVPSVVLGGNTQPLLRELGLGDSLWFAASSPLDPPDPVTGAPGLQIQARISGWDLQPPAKGQAEQITLQLGQMSGFMSTGAVG